MGWTIPVQPTAYTPQIATDTTSRTVTAQVLTQLSGDFSVPANDASAGSVYKMRFWGTYFASGAAITLTFGVVIFGTTFTVSAITNVNTGGVTIPYVVDVELIVVTAGAAGTVSGIITWLSTTVGNVSALSDFSGAVNTTASSVFGVEAEWSLATGSITAVASVYERDGPGAVAQ